MIIAFGADERTPLTAMLAQELWRRGHEVRLYGAVAGEPLEWSAVGEQVGRAVAEGSADQGVLCCWTGTGVSMAANKIAGVRAALCGDAETARGARRWNDANVLCLSLRSISEPVAREMLDAWFAAEPDPSEAGNIRHVAALDADRMIR